MKNCTRVLGAVLCVLVFFTAGKLTAQTAPFTHQGLTASTGDFLGFLQYKPADYDQHLSTKYPIIIFLHGIGERGNGTTELDKVAYVGMPRIIYKGNKMRFTWNGKTETFLVLAPQCPMKYGMWPAAFINDLIKYAKNNLRIDTDRIYLTGLSMGGGGSYRYISDALPDNPKNLAAVCTIAAPCTFGSGKYAAAANLPIWSFHAEDDPTALAKCTKNAITNLNQWKVSPKPLMDLWPTGGHIVWDRVYTDTNYKYQGVVNIYEWFLGQNRKLPVNKLPVARASNVTVTTGTGMATLDASASSDEDGRLVRYVWKKISGPSAGEITTKMGSASSTTVTGLTVPGTYQYAVFAVDDRAAFTSDTITVTVNQGPAGNPAPTPNASPVAKAGTDIAITLPVNQATLNASGSSDADGSISSYSWSKISGPASFSIAASGAAVTKVNNLTAGTYVFQIIVKDNKGAKDTASVSVKVNAAANTAPVANAGTDITITLPLNTVVLDGSASADADGTISSFAWSKITGPVSFSIASTTTAGTSVNNLVQGTYQFRLLVKDNKGASASDTIVVKVLQAVNILPVAKAGTDISITLPLNTVTLNGNGSTDADGVINSYSWLRISGPSQFSISNPNAPSTMVRNLVEGTYQFRLLVTDNRGGISTDTIKVIVHAAPPPPNVAPVADAGADRVITAPASVAVISGAQSFDPDGSITTYAWTKIGGPAGGAIVNASLVTTSATGLVEGTYRFRLSVTDDDGASDADTVTIYVNAAILPPPVPNMAPVAKAGNNITITLPVDNTTLNGSASVDADGSIEHYSWSKISGPAQFGITSPASSITDITNLVEGVYAFRLQVKDNDGETGRDTITVTVLPSLNNAPIADAGQDFTVNLPDPVIRLNGLGSTDPDGEIVTYSWTRVSGPAGVTITNSSTATPGVTGVTTGEYIFRLTITDNTGATGFDDVKVTVQPADDEQAPPVVYNYAPNAVAGPDQTVGIPETSTTLNGSSSNDVDGNISSYSWTQISGPSLAGIDSPDSTIAGVTGLTEGEYIFELTVTDNTGAFTKDTVMVSVVNNLRYEQQMSVYPNPARSNVMLQMTSDTSGQARISVYNVNGVMVKSFYTRKAPGLFRSNIDVSELQAGLYYVEIVIAHKQKMITKFIKR